MLYISGLYANQIASTKEDMKLDASFPTIRTWLHWGFLRFSCLKSQTFTNCHGSPFWQQLCHSGTRVSGLDCPLQGSSPVMFIFPFFLLFSFGTVIYLFLFLFFLNLDKFFIITICTTVKRKFQRFLSNQFERITSNQLLTIQKNHTHNHINCSVVFFISLSPANWGLEIWYKDSSHKATKKTY